MRKTHRVEYLYPLLSFSVVHSPYLSVSCSLSLFLSLSFILFLMILFIFFLLTPLLLSSSLSYSLSSYFFISFTLSLSLSLSFLSLFYSLSPYFLRSSMRLGHPPDGSTSPKYKLLCFITTKKICKEKNTLAFNQDRGCHLVICLQLIPFHSLSFLSLFYSVSLPFFLSFPYALSLFLFVSLFNSLSYSLSFFLFLYHFLPLSPSLFLSLFLPRYSLSLSIFHLNFQTNFQKCMIQLLSII
jgi:hypothetical protein